MAETLATLLTEGRERLAGAPFEPSTREAALLLGHVLGLTEAEVLTRSLDAVGPDAAARFRALLDRRLAGEPIAYILGEKEFYGRTFRVDPRVLIPRPETEHLVEAAVELDLPERPLILDLGTGSGCLAITLALELPESRIVATDLAPGALAVATANALEHSVGDRVRWLAGDLGAPLDLTPFDLVVSNPPYIDPAVREHLSIEVSDFEPARALFAPGRGDSLLERLTRELTRLRPGTPVLLEIGHDQAERIARLARDQGFVFGGIRRDLAGHPRLATLLAPSSARADSVE